MRSLARLFSSSRRAPPNAASKPYFVERLLERLRLHDVGVDRRAVREGVDALREAFRVRVHQQFEAVLVHHALAERVHLAELPLRVHVQQRERQPGRVEGLERQVQHHRAVLPDRVQHDRPVALRHDLAHDVDALGLEPLEVRQRTVVESVVHAILTTVRPVTRPWR